MNHLFFDLKSCDNPNPGDYQLKDISFAAKNIDHIKVKC